MISARKSSYEHESYVKKYTFNEAFQYKSENRSENKEYRKREHCKKSIDKQFSLLFENAVVQKKLFRKEFG